MYYAETIKKQKINIKNASVNGEYYCPICGERLQQKRGKHKQWHFAHRPNSKCTDHWHYDMTEWHKSMQSIFDEKNQEVVVTFEGQKHRADVLIGDTVIEFQHSKINPQDFCDRNDFYIKAGYKVVWVFDLSEHCDNGWVYEDNETKHLYNWVTKPKNCLLYGPIPQNNMKDISICFMLNNDEHKNIVYRVMWAKIDREGKPTYDRFYINHLCGVQLKKNMNIKQLFWDHDNWMEYCNCADSYAIEIFNKTVTNTFDECAW